MSVTLGSIEGSMPFTSTKPLLRPVIIALPVTAGAAPITPGTFRSFSTSAR
jgi:hypothetical protein